MSLSAGEQYLLELINRARLDPAAEAQRYKLSLNAGLDNGTIGKNALQVLAPDTALESAATSHSAWMLDADVFSHAGAQGSNAGDRIENNGYVFEGSWAWRENLAWFGSTGNVNMQAAISKHHEALYRSESHRVNTFATNITEVGIGQVAGKLDYNGNNYNSSMLTLNYAKSGTEIFITGVAYADSDKDRFYSIGEGESGIWVKAEGSRTITAGAGGYGVGMTGVDTADVSIGKGTATYGKLSVDVMDGNAKVDLMIKDNGAKWLMLSASSDLGSGLKNAELLGVANLDLTGSGGRNRLVGNDGDNIIRGHGGNDKLWGNEGRDVLKGGNGADGLYGGAGNDKLWGNEGRDVLKGGSGADVLYGGAGNDKLWGNEGRDVLNGGNGADNLYGGAGSDKLRGGDQNDFLLGNKGADDLRGGGGRDTLKGGNGNDRLDGQRGNDILTGGIGRDEFVFNKGHDKITDFENNVDTIYIDDTLGANGTLTMSELMDMGEIRNGCAVFEFNANDVLAIDGVDNLAILANDLIFI